jgi:hypothetical protein
MIFLDTDVLIDGAGWRDWRGADCGWGGNASKVRPSQ